MKTIWFILEQLHRKCLYRVPDNQFGNIIDYPIIFLPVSILKYFLCDCPHKNSNCTDPVGLWHAWLSVECVVQRNEEGQGLGIRYLAI